MCHFLDGFLGIVHADSRISVYKRFNLTGDTCVLVFLILCKLCTDKIHGNSKQHLFETLLLIDINREQTPNIESQSSVITCEKKTF